MTKRTWRDNAEEFAQLDQGEGWPFAILVACSVQKGQSQGKYRELLRPGEEVFDEMTEKVSAARFAEVAGTSADRVLRYLNAWQKAAEDGVVKDAEELTPEDAHKVAVPEAPWKVSKGGYYERRSASIPEDRPGAVAKALEDPEFRQKVLERTEPHVKAQVAAEIAETRYVPNVRTFAPYETEYKPHPLELLESCEQATRFIRHYSKRLYDLAKNPGFSVEDRLAVVESIRQIISQLELVAEVFGNPDSATVTDETIEKLLGGTV